MPPPPSPSSVLSLLRDCKTIGYLTQVHTHIVRKGCQQDHFLIARFISVCVSLLPTNISYPTSIFNSVTCPNIYLWNILLKAHCENSALHDCFSFFSRMRRCSSVAPDRYTFPPIIKACSSVLALKEGLIVHGAAVRCGVCEDGFVGSSLITLYGKCGEIECARRVFDDLPVKNEVSWTALLMGCLNSGNISNARYLFDEIPIRNETTWNVMINGLVKLGDTDSAKELFDKMPVRSELSFTTLIDGYAKAGDMVAAKSLFDRLPHKDVVSWSALISGYVQNGESGEAVRAFREMQASGLRPDEFVMVSLMCACSQLGSLELARWIESYLATNGPFNLTRIHVAAALVDMNAKCGDMERANWLFEKMRRRDLVSYCSIMQGLCIHGRGAEAVPLFDRMISEGVRPDGVAFTVVLSACAAAGLMDDGCRYFEMMSRDYSISPKPVHYACMVSLLGKCGKVRLAYELIRSIPVAVVESNAGAWGALLEACRLHGDVDVGELVAHTLFHIEPQNACSYVLLSNIYAKVDRWTSVSCLRERMRDKGVRKIPGCTYIDSHSLPPPTK